jgi:hypothetical protein
VLVRAEQARQARELLQRPVDLPETASDEPESEH